MQVTIILLVRRLNYKLCKFCRLGIFGQSIDRDLTAERLRQKNISGTFFKKLRPYDYLVR